MFLDVEAQPIELEKLEKTPVYSRPMNQTIYLEREIEKAAGKFPSVRYPIIPASATDGDGIGGLELSVARVNAYGLNLRTDRFCIVSVVRGQGVVQMAGVERAVGPREHFSVPAGIPALLRQEGNEPMVTLDVVIKEARHSISTPRWRRNRP